MKNIKKYRPSLSEQQIGLIIDLCKAQNPISPEAVQIISVLAPYYTKIAVGAVTSAYTVSTPIVKSTSDLLADIGGAPSKPISKSSYWAECYNKFLANNSNPDTLTKQELDACYEHMYLHGLFTPEEQESFEFGTLRNLL